RLTPVTERCSSQRPSNGWPKACRWESGFACARNRNAARSPGQMSNVSFPFPAVAMSWFFMRTLSNRKTPGPAAESCCRCALAFLPRPSAMFQIIWLARTRPAARRHLEKHTVRHDCEIHEYEENFIQKNTNL